MTHVILSLNFDILAFKLSLPTRTSLKFVQININSAESTQLSSQKSDSLNKEISNFPVSTPKKKKSNSAESTQLSSPGSDYTLNKKRASLKFVRKSVTRPNQLSYEAQNQIRCLH